MPPATSAKKIGGEAAYRKAHRGEEVILPPSRVYLHEAAWLRHEAPDRSWLRLDLPGRLMSAAWPGTWARPRVRLPPRGLRRTAVVPGRIQAKGSACGSMARPSCPGAGPAHSSTTREAAALLRGRPSPWAWRRPTWTVPTGFPEPEAPLRGGLHAGKLVALLKEKEGAHSGPPPTSAAGI
ncbi:MAG: hypothetical protein IPL96_17910 [Holophagaceae bacterium]|nr:hypothetical protein [Holophagaceae bacterium]